MVVCTAGRGQVRGLLPCHGACTFDSAACGTQSVTVHDEPGKEGAGAPAAAIVALLPHARQRKVGKEEDESTAASKTNKGEGRREGLPRGRGGRRLLFSSQTNMRASLAILRGRNSTSRDVAIASGDPASRSCWMQLH